MLKTTIFDYNEKSGIIINYITTNFNQTKQSI